MQYRRLCGHYKLPSALCNASSTNPSEGHCCRSAWHTIGQLLPPTSIQIHLWSDQHNGPNRAGPYRRGNWSQVDQMLNKLSWWPRHIACLPCRGVVVVAATCCSMLADSMIVPCMHVVRFKSTPCKAGDWASAAKQQLAAYVTSVLLNLQWFHWQPCC